MGMGMNMPSSHRGPSSDNIHTAKGLPKEPHLKAGFVAGKQICLAYICREIVPSVGTTKEKGRTSQETII